MYEGGMKKMNLTEKTIASNFIYKGKIINLRVDQIELPNGKSATREVVEHSGAVCVAPLTKEGEIYLVSQFRYPKGEQILELPAGKLEKGENPLEAGKRELKEETGCIGKNYFELGKFYGTPAFCEETVHIYGCEVETVGKLDLDDDEFLNVVKMPLTEAVDMVMQNKISDGKTQVGILKLLQQERTKQN